MEMKKNYKITSRITGIVMIVLFMEIGMFLLFFMQYRRIVKDETIKLYQNFTGQIVEQFIDEKENKKNIAFQVSYSNGVQEYLLEKNKIERFKKLSYLQENLEYVLSANKDILNIRVLGTEGRLLNSNRGTQLSTVPSLFIDEAAEEMLEKETSEGMFTKFVYSKLDETVYYSYLMPMYSSYQKRGSSEMIGVCAVTSSLSGLQRNMNTVTMQDGTEYMIVDYDNRILAANDTEMIGEILSDADQWDFSSGDSVIFKQDASFLHIIMNSNEGLILLYSIPNSRLTEDIPRVLMILFGVILIVTIIIFVVTLRLLYNITHPISVMVEEIRGITMQAQNNRISMIANNEIGAIAVEINQMLERIDRFNQERIQATNELTKAKLLQKQAELSFLRSQINPHFLYNSLECIRGMAFACGAKEIESITTSLSKLYRYALSSNETVYLKDELKCVVEYYNIMSIRFRKNYHFIVKVPKVLMKEPVIPMILQPIVENSFKHGFTSGRGTMIQIEGWEEENFLFLQISDDGKGMGQEDIRKISAYLDKEEKTETEMNSIGLINIQKRIQMQYGKECGITLKSNHYHGLTVLVTLAKNKI